MFKFRTKSTILKSSKGGGDDFPADQDPLQSVLSALKGKTSFFLFEDYLFVPKNSKFYQSKRSFPYLK